MLKLPPILQGLVLSIVAALVMQAMGLVPNPAAGDKIAVFGTLAQIAGTMLGFMLAALAIVASISETALLKRMREQGYQQALLQNLFAGAALFLGCTVLSMLVLLGVSMPTWAMPLLFGLHVAALVVLFVIGWQFWLTLSNLHPTHDDSPREMPKLD